MWSGSQWIVVRVFLCEFLVGCCQSVVWEAVGTLDSVQVRKYDNVNVKFILKGHIF